MEQILKDEKVLLKTLWPVLLIFGMALAMVIIVYGMESIAHGVHDAFHDFRHVIGMPCH
jgi:cobalt transporter subunit CbtB